MSDGDTVTRPDGRVYRSRKVTANAVSDDCDDITGVMVLGTHDTGRAQKLADEYVAWQVDNGQVAVGPVAGWWRDGFEGGRRTWVADEKHGRAGIWFREIVERSDEGDDR